MAVKWYIANPLQDDDGSSITRHLQISYACVAAMKADRALPTGEARAHPGLEIEWHRFDRKREGGDRNLPLNGKLASFDLDRRLRRHADIGGRNRPRRAIGHDPVAGHVIVAVGLAHPVQHELFAGLEVEREPVPAGLVGRERLAAPFPVHPGLARDVHGLVVDRNAAGYL